jgi:hypothetical protein
MRRVGEAPRADLRDLGVEHVASERVRALSAGDGDDAAIEARAPHRTPARPRGVTTWARSAPVPIMLTSRSSAASTNST